MKNLLPLLACFVALIACNNRNSANSVNETNSTENMEVVSNEQTTPIVADTIDSDTTEEKRSESLNDIRFAGWGKAEWVDNEYIRTVRRYLDAYNNGEIEDADLDEYKDCVQGKFVIGDIQPWMLGGAIIYIVFYDHPEKLFYSVVYSYVDEQTREVYDYECRGIRLETAEFGSSQDEIEEFLKDCPEHRMW